MGTVIQIPVSPRTRIGFNASLNVHPVYSALSLETKARLRLGTRIRFNASLNNHPVYSALSLEAKAIHRWFCKRRFDVV